MNLLKSFNGNVEEVSNAMILSLLEKDGNGDTMYCQELASVKGLVDVLRGLDLPYMSFKTIGVGSNIHLVAGVYLWPDINMDLVKEYVDKYSKKLVLVLNQRGCGFGAIQEVLPYARILKQPKPVVVEPAMVPVEKVVEAQVVEEPVVETKVIEVTKDMVEATLVSNLPRFYAAGSVDSNGPKLGSGVLYPDSKEWKGICSNADLVASWSYGAEVYAAAIAVSGASSLGLTEIEIAVSNDAVIQLAKNEVKVTKPAGIWFQNVLKKFANTQIHWVLVDSEANLAKDLAKAALA